MRSIESIKTNYRISDFLTWQREKTLVLNPNFQRRSVWKKGAKSYLIDSILKGLPIPIIFLRDLRADLKTFKSKRDVVDGQQRLRTIIAYIAPNLLDNFDEERDGFVISRTHNPDYAGKRFEDLPPDARQKILDYEFSVHAFKSDTDDKEILQIFARMNSTGAKLNTQELRNAEFFGEFRESAYELALEQLQRWMDWGIFSSDQISRMSEVELTGDFIILMLQGLVGHSNVRADRYYKDYDDDFPSRIEVSNRLRDVMDAIAQSFEGEDIKRLLSNKTIFRALFSVIYDARYGLRDGTDVDSPLTERQIQLARTKPKHIDSNLLRTIVERAKVINAREAPQDVREALRGATSDIGSRRLVLDFLSGRRGV